MNNRLAGHVVIISEQNGQCYLQRYPDNVIRAGMRALLGKYVFFLCSLILQCFSVLMLVTSIGRIAMKSVALCDGNGDLG
jgi:hypothetical protein